VNDPTLPDNNASIHDLESLQSALHNLIPISKHMGIEASQYDGQCLILKAPLENNINHQRSAFGGSLFSLSALAGWGILQLKLAELGIKANTVIAGGDVGYSLPVFETLVCEITLPDAYPEFQAKLIANGKASILLTTNIIVEGVSAMTFNGKFVVREIKAKT
jgi:thioesterase domain-containing protein